MNTYSVNPSKPKKTKSKKSDVEIDRSKSTSTIWKVCNYVWIFLWFSMVVTSKWTNLELSLYSNIFGIPLIASLLGYISYKINQL